MLPWKKDVLQHNDEAPIYLSCANCHNVHVHTGPTRQPTILTEAPRAPKPHMSPNTGQQPQNHKEPKAAKLYRTLFITLEPRS